ncbi:MAG TPA: exopolysaccharide biosynthesis polyprenyl glycosylphosphotransferase [Gaiellaceae bacterium]|nr:exopolysaccharide biosynthesis polyprenyl glycosylphosphotransferase [Gaiellaceae bacterium]
MERVETAAVYSFVWSLAVGMGCSLSGSFLTALGPRVAVARGVLLALVISSAAGRWLPGLRMSFEATVLVGVVVFVLSAWWETFSLRHVMPAARLLIVGTGSGAVNLVHDVQQGRGGGYMVVGVVSEEALPGLYHGVPVLGRTDDLQDVISEHTPDIVVLAPGPNRPQTFLQLLEAAEVGFRVVELAQFYEHAYGRVPVEDLTRAWFMSVLHLYQRPYSRVLKRTVDLVGACLVFLFTLPLFPLLALLVRRSEGPVLIRQLRLGEHGRLFTIYKFRTMYADAETPGRAVWAHVEDPRVTRLGGIMRRLRLDELPQLWNVIRGDMSLVGPRPERPEFLDELAARVPYWTRRHLVKPGLTGWAQVRQGYTASAEATSEKLSYDLWYIRHRSLVVDLAILLRTFAVVLQGDRKHHAPSSREREARVETLAPADS